MGLLRSIGNMVQKALFTTTFDDIMASLDDVQRRIGTLEQKIEDRTRELERRLADLRGVSAGEDQSQAS